MTAISKATLFNAYPTAGQKQNLIINGKTPSLSHLLFAAHNIIQNEKSAKDRKRLYTIVDQEYTSKRHAGCCWVQLVIAIVNYFKGRGFIDEIDLYFKIDKMRRRDNELNLSSKSSMHKSASRKAASGTSEPPPIAAPLPSPPPVPSVQPAWPFTSRQRL